MTGILASLCEQSESLNNLLRPIKIEGLSRIKAIDAGLGHYVALKDDGTVWSWGNNDYCQTGNEFKGTRYYREDNIVTSGNGTDLPKNEWIDHAAVSDIRTTPAQITGGLTNIVSIAAGNDFNLAVRSDGSVWTWGNNTSIKLGRTDNKLLGPVPELLLFDPDKYAIREQKACLKIYPLEYTISLKWSAMKAGNTISHAVELLKI